MINIVFAYILVFFLAPLLSGLFCIFSIPLFMLVGKIVGEGKVNPKIWCWCCDLSRGIISIVAGFIAVWVGKIIFALLDISPSLLMVLMIGAGFILNDVRRILSSSKSIIRSELFGAVGHLLGIIIGGIKLI